MPLLAPDFASTAGSDLDGAAPALPQCGHGQAPGSCGPTLGRPFGLPRRRVRTGLFRYEFMRLT